MRPDQRLAEIERRLRAAFEPLELEVRDESHHHVGHAGARDGRGHYRVRIVARAFQGQPPLTRHRMIYQALGELLQTDIHALAIEAEPPGVE